MPRPGCCCALPGQPDVPRHRRPLLSRLGEEKREGDCRESRCRENRTAPVHAGGAGGFVGIHYAFGTEYNWP
jgi:hypothetical protein